MSQISVSRLRRKPSLVRGKEESATQRAERKKFIRSMMEERTSKFEDTTLTEEIVTKDSKGHDVSKVRPLSQAFELSRAIEVATHGWGLGKKYPIQIANILAFKKLANIATLFEQDLGPDHPATKWILGKLQNHALTLWPRSNTYDAKEIDMVESKPDIAEVLKELYGGKLGLNLPVATDLKNKPEAQAETDD